MKATIRRVLSQPWLNAPARIGLRMVQRIGLIPEKALWRFPVHGAVDIRWNGHTVRMDAGGDDTIAARIYWSGIGEYEPSTFSVFDKLLSVSGTFFDIGANTGIYSLLAATDSTRSIHAFEPMPQIYARLQHNVLLNKFTNVTTSQCAVADFDGSITLYIPKDVMIPTGASTLKGFRAAKENVEVPAVTLDTYVKRAKITELDLIKIDTEGTEHLAFAGAQEVLVAMQPAIICEVLKGRTEDKLPAVLQPAGYRYYWITENGLLEKKEIVGDPTYQNSNYLFATPARMAQIQDALGKSMLHIVQPTSGELL